jgi:glutamine synthetase
MTKEDILRIVKEEHVKFIRLWFSDIIGIPKSFAVPQDVLEDALDNGKGFDGSSIEGFTRIHESDMIAKPDPTTFQILPWSHPEVREARLICDIQNPDGSPYDCDPRWILKKTLREAEGIGFVFYVGPELEYFYFKNSTEPLPMDSGGYFDLTPPDLGDELRRKTILALDKIGIDVEYSHHEVAPSQHEIDLKYSEALTMADTTMTYRLVVKEIAQQNGVYASFMPKPIFGVNGSGMHVHQSLFRGERNAFHSSSDPMNLSDTAKYYIAGLLHFSKEITAVTNQYVNSYKRLVPGYEAPVYICWGQRNRSALVRVPKYKPGQENATRIEYRSPDPSCNPYLAFAVMLAAGLEGIKKKLPLPEAKEKDLYDMSEEEIAHEQIEFLPGSMEVALEIAEASELVKRTLGENLFFKFLRNRYAEWESYRMQITPYEYEKFLPVL